MRLFLADSVYCPSDGETIGSYVIYKQWRNGSGGRPRHTIHVRHLEMANIIFYDQHHETLPGQLSYKNGWDHWFGWGAADFEYHD